MGGINHQKLMIYSCYTNITPSTDPGEETIAQGSSQSAEAWCWAAICRRGHRSSAINAVQRDFLQTLELHGMTLDDFGVVAKFKSILGYRGNLDQQPKQTFSTR